MNYISNSNIDYKLKGSLSSFSLINERIKSKENFEKDYLRKKIKNKNNNGNSNISNCYQKNKSFEINKNENKIKKNFSFNKIINNRVNYNYIENNIKKEIKKIKKIKKGNFISKNMNSPYYKKINIEKKSNIKYYNNLYQRCKLQKILKEDKFEEERFNNKKKEINYSFTPKINKNLNSSNIKNKDSKTKRLKRFLINNELFQKKKKYNLIKIIKNIILENKEETTFTPKINKTISSDDIKIISYEIPYINNYVLERRNFIKKKEEEKNKKNNLNHPFLISQRKFPIKNYNNNNKLIKDLKYFRKISAKEVLEKRKKFGFDNFYNNNNLNNTFNLFNNPFNNNCENDNSRNFTDNKFNNNSTAEFKKN